MKIHPFARLNPVAAFRQYGARYAIFTAAKASVLVANLVLGLATLIACYAEWEIYAICQNVAAVMLKLASVVVPFLIFESVYWMYLFRQRKASEEQGRRTCIDG